MKKKGQLISFWRINTAKLTKICVKPISNTAIPNSRSDFRYSYIKCPKIAIEIITKLQKSYFKNKLRDERKKTI